MARQEGKIYVEFLENEGNTPLRFMGGDQTDLGNYKRLSTSERMFESVRGTGFNLENLPSLRDLMGEDEQLSPNSNLWLAMGQAGGEEKLKQVVSGFLQNPEFKNDENGRPVVSFTNSDGGRTRAYLNKPGLSAQDAARFLGETAALTAGGRAFGVGKQGVGMLSNAMRMFAGGAAGSAGADIAADTLSGQPVLESALNVNVPRALETGLAESAFGTFAETVMLAAPALRNLMNRGEQIVDRQGQLTENGQAALKELGINYNETSQAFKDELLRRTLSGGELNASQTAILAEAQSLPTAVPMTRGQVTGMPSEQLREDMMRKGVYGEAVEQQMAQNVARQTDALESNLNEMQRQIAQRADPNAPTIARGEGAANVQASLAQQRIDARASKNEAYKQARLDDIALFGGTFSGEGVTEYSKPAIEALASRIENTLVRDFTRDDLQGAPTTLITQLRDFAARPSGRPVSVREMFEWRRRLNNAIEGGTPTGTALAQTKRLFDEQMNSALDSALIRGNPDQLKMWQDAIKANADFKRRFESGDMVDLLTALQPGTAVDQMSLRVAPADAANFIFNASNTGFITKRNLQRDLLKMRDLLPPSEFDQLRQELFIRLTAGGRTRAGDISGAKMRSAIEDSVERAKPVLNAAFSADEIALMRQFGRVADRVQNTTKNTSNTAIANARNLQDLTRNVIAAFGMRGPALEKLLIGLPVLSATVGPTVSRARSVFTLPQQLDYTGSVPRLSPLPVAAGGAAITEEQPDLNERLLPQ